MTEIQRKRLPLCGLAGLGVILANELLLRFEGMNDRAVPGSVPRDRKIEGGSQ